MLPDLFAALVFWRLVFFEGQHVVRSWQGPLAGIPLDHPEAGLIEQRLKVFSYRTELLGTNVELLLWWTAKAPDEGFRIAAEGQTSKVSLVKPVAYLS